jgi:hypothetical protein
MITLPTGDLVGCLADVIPFAELDDELPETCCVHLRWDGQFHAEATDTEKFGWSSWNPRDHEGDSWGGADEPWSASISLADAKALTKMFKLPKARMWQPVTVEHIGRSVRIKRDKVDELPSLVMVAADNFLEFPDLQQRLADHSTVEAVPGVAFNAANLAAFGKVRPYGPMAITFTGEKSLALVNIGARFTGGIWPAKAA